MDAVGGTCSRIFFPFSLSYFCDELKPCAAGALKQFERAE